MSKYPILTSGILLSICMLFFFWYSNVDKTYSLSGHELVKSRDLKLSKSKNQDTTELKKIETTDTVIPNYDTARKNILLIGDSEAEGLMYPLYDYCLSSGHKLNAAMVWYSATDKTYANNDTLSKVIEKYTPDYIITVIGLNQIFQANHDGSVEAVKKIISVFKETPYAWIGPANWVEDKGINDVYANETGKGTFFLSKKLQLQRGGDGRHPSMQGYRIWMDSIAYWLQNKAKWKINMVKPVEINHKRNFPLIMLNAAKPLEKKKEDKKAVKKNDSTTAEPESTKEDQLL